MARSKNPQVYDESFADLVREASVREVRIPFETEKEAMSMRGSLYGYHSALEAAKNKPGATKEDILLRQQSYKVAYRIEGTVLIAHPKDLSKRSLTLRAALARAQYSRPIVTDESCIPEPSSFLTTLVKGSKNE